jgi:hypothetical protein
MIMEIYINPSKVVAELKFIHGCVLKNREFTYHESIIYHVYEKEVKCRDK